MQHGSSHQTAQFALTLLPHQTAGTHRHVLPGLCLQPAQMDVLLRILVGVLHLIIVLLPPLLIITIGSRMCKIGQPLHLFILDLSPFCSLFCCGRTVFPSHPFYPAHSPKDLNRPIKTTIWTGCSDVWWKEASLWLSFWRKAFNWLSFG